MVVKVKLTPVHRVVSLALLGLSAITFLWFGIEFFHFTVHPFLNHPSLAGEPTGQSSNYLWNALLLTAFFLQHYIMADLTFKKTMTSIYPLYPVFERYLFNNAAALLFIFFTTHCSVGNQVLFVFPKLIMAVHIVGVPLFLISQTQMLENLFVPFPIMDIINKDELSFELEPTQKKRGLTTKGTFGICRNPMYLSVMLILIGTSRVLTVDRLIYDVLMYVGIFYGVLREEAKMRLEYADYDEYCLKVPNRFIPVLSNLIPK